MVFYLTFITCILNDEKESEHKFGIHILIASNGSNEWNKIVSNQKPVQHISKCLQNLSIYIPEKRKDPKMSACYT